MKTKTFFFICLLLGIGLTRLSAQPPDPLPPGVTKTYTWTQEFPDYWAVCYCNGELVDNLTGSGRCGFVVHITDGKLDWYSYHFKGEATGSLNPNEIFEIRENAQPLYFDENGNPIYQTINLNYRGNQGTHYIGSLSFDFGTGEWIINKAVCIENGPKRK